MHQLNYLQELQMEVLKQLLVEHFHLVLVRKLMRSYILLQIYLLVELNFQMLFNSFFSKKEKEREKKS